MEGREGAEERGKMKGGLCSSKLFLGKTLLKTKQDRPIELLRNWKQQYTIS